MFQVLRLHARRPFIQSLAVFAAALAVLLALLSPRLLFTNDEGIILEAAQRMAQGQTLYVDFFGYMSPGSYWIQQAFFQVLGFTQMAARLPVMLDMALSTALLYWIAARLSNQFAAGVVTVCYFILQAATPGMLTAQHRWDSSALSLAAIALALQASESSETRRAQWLVSGALFSAAAFCTPSLGLLAAVTFVWLAVTPARRASAVWLAAGGITVAALATGAMAATGIFRPFLDQMAWLRNNYSDVNVMPYGAIIGGYATLFEGATPATVIIHVTLVICLAAAAIVPVASAAGWLGALRFARELPLPKSTILWLIACVTAYVATAFPRPDVMHLAFVAALPSALTAAFAARYVPKPLQIATSFVFVLGGIMFLFQTSGDHFRASGFPTPVGNIRALDHERDAIQAICSRVRPGDSLYVHPYMPVLYFLTQAKNPARFSYLAPGMMTAREEQMTIDDLKQNPPRWVLYMDLQRAEFLRVFPNAGNLNHKFEAMERYLAENYQPVREKTAAAGYQLLERKPASANAPATSPSTAVPPPPPPATLPNSRAGL